MEYNWEMFDKEEDLIDKFAQGHSVGCKIRLVKLRDKGVKNLSADELCFLGRIFSEWIRMKTESIVNYTEQSL